MNNIDSQNMSNENMDNDIPHELIEKFNNTYSTFYDMLPEAVKHNLKMYTIGFMMLAMYPLTDEEKAQLIEITQKQLIHLQEHIDVCKNLKYKNTEE